MKVNLAWRLIQLRRCGFINTGNILCVPMRIGMLCIQKRGFKILKKVKKSCGVMENYLLLWKKFLASMQCIRRGEKFMLAKRDFF